jgi:thiosulfate/3-mercaptopyruvate sulfurtransferase
MDPFLKDSNSNGPISAKLFGQLCAVLGIGKDTHVVAYDGGSVMWASRFWWTMKYYGHDQVSVLDGCWPAYVRSGAPISIDIEQPEYTSDYSPQARNEWFASAQDILEVLESTSGSSGSVQLLDTRSKGEYRGDELKGNARGGHVPGARNVPHTDMIKPDGTFKSPQELSRIFEKAGLNLSKPCISYCQLGIRGAMGALAWTMAGQGAGLADGAQKVANYDASMKEWLNNPKLPVDR